MKLKKEEQILDEDFRKDVIEEILDEENQIRKMREKKRYDVYKDGTRKYVIERLEKEYSNADTLQDAIHRTANLSILRKIIDKKSVVYKDGVIREVNSEQGKEEKQEQLDSFTDLLNINSAMKKVNRYLENHKNCDVYITPYDCPMTGYKKIRLQVLPPYLYDVIEDAENPEIPRVYVFSYMPSVEQKTYSKGHGQSGSRSHQRETNSFRGGDSKDQIIADSPADFGKNEMRFVWWSNNFHFTTNGKGEILNDTSDEELIIENPIGRVPFVNFSKDRDGQFWAIGGDDLIEGSILINHLLTDLYFIAKYQGFGIFYLIGKGLPKDFKIGPTDAVLLEQQEGDPDAQIGFATSSPPLESHMKMIEQYMAMLLSTNNLEPGTVSGELSATSASSGIQEMIRQSELVDDIEDQRELYRDQEPHIYDIIFLWQNLLFESGELDKKFADIGMVDIDDFDYSLKFPSPKRFMTDKEKLEIIEKRLDLGLDTKIDAIMRDNPDLTEEQAREKLAQILAEKLERQREFINGQIIQKDEEENENTKEENNQEEEQE